MHTDDSKKIIEMNLLPWKKLGKTRDKRHWFIIKLDSLLLTIPNPVPDVEEYSFEFLQKPTLSIIT